MKFFKSSNHGQELIIIAAIAVILGSYFFLKRYKRQLYEPGQAACIADCSQVNGNFRRYNHNIFSVDQCVCIVRGQIRNIWN